MASHQHQASSASPPPEALVSHDELLRVLRTPFEAVFSLNQDGTEFFMPSVMRGVPVALISEESPYWNSSWASVDEFLSKEDDEEKAKQQYKELAILQPNNKAIRNEEKKHQDNMSKYHKIREIFGPGSDYHPNQLLSKCHFPPDGLCSKDTMYRLACKISELRVLQERNYLAMDPFDFLRWRIAIKVQDHLRFPGDQASSFIKSAIHRLCDLDESHNRNHYADPLMRAAVILAAKLQNRPNLYKSGQTGRQKSVPRIPGALMAPTIARKPGRPRGRPKGPTRPTQDQAREAARREKRAKLAAALPQSTYQGVNAWRAKRDARSSGK